MSLARIRDFKAPTDAATAAELRRQLGEFEANVASMGDEIAKPTMPRLSVADRDRRSSGLLLAPGQAAGIVTASGDTYVSLSKPQPGDEGKFVYLWSPNQLNHIFVNVAAGSKINGVDQSVFNMAARFTILIFCDGIGYWAD